MKKTILTALIALALAAAGPTAFARELALGGQVVGIQVSTAGVLVAGTGAVETAEGSRSPAEEAGVHAGDVIVELGGRKVRDAGELIGAVAALEGADAELTVLRGGKPLLLTLKPARSDENKWMLGMWLRDGISGIGTVTFCDPATGLYGALGHSISDTDSGAKLPMDEGSITEAEIVSIKPGAAGAPGELNGSADPGKVLGSIERNTDHGIFGHMNRPGGGRVVETGEIRTGPATILATVDEGKTREFSVRVSRIYRDGDGEHVMLSVTDPELCARTGGIVQGMSGSPILQDGKLVGAVTHVFLSDPKRGYGISIRDMLDDAGVLDEAA